MPIFYNSKLGRGLEPVQTKGKGLEPVQAKKGKGCNKKCNKKQLRGSGFFLINFKLIFLNNVLWKIIIF